MMSLVQQTGTKWKFENLYSTWTAENDSFDADGFSAPLNTVPEAHDSFYQ